MQAIVNFSNGASALVFVNSSYIRAGVHYYDLTVKQPYRAGGFLDFNPGLRKLYTKAEVTKLTYVMS